ncbi:MAG: UMP kinase [Methanomicrobiales archaeon]|nr:UMP kinase [Methanomicrobiales archaeon]
MKTIVVSLGGSILVPSLDSHHIREYATILRELASRYRVFVVVGGGGEARRYITAARDLGMDEATADDIGILVTRLNAALLAGALGESAYPRVAETYVEARENAESGKIVVLGGVIPGQTTDAVAAVLSEYTHAIALFNVTSVEGIYSADPRKEPRAVRHAHLTPGQLLEIIRKNQLAAGSNTVFDIVAVKVVERSRIPLFVLDGRDPHAFRAAVLEGAFTGTVVCEGPPMALPL